jgi:uncharacterized protein YjbJ (UPF0337 family)
MKLKSIFQQAALICCVLAVFLSLQTISLASRGAIASPISQASSMSQTVADNHIGGNAPNDRAMVNKVKEDVKSAFDNVAGSGSANRIEGKAEKDSGRVQKGLGNVQNQVEGVAKQVQGNAKQATGKAQNAVEDATESVQDKAGEAIDAVKDFFNK